MHRQLWDLQHCESNILCPDTDCMIWVSCLDLLIAQVETFGGDPFTQVKSGHLSVRGKGRFFSVAERFPADYIPDMHHIDLQGFNTSAACESLRENVSITLDRRGNTLPENAELLCLVLGVSSNKEC